MTIRILGFSSGFLNSRRTCSSVSESCSSATSRPIHHVAAFLGVHGVRPLGRQILVECLLVFGAGFSVHGDQEGLVPERQYVLFEVLSDELATFSTRSSRARNVRRPTARSRTLLSSSTSVTSSSSASEKNSSSSPRRHRHLARRQLVLDRQRRLVPIDSLMEYLSR